MSKLDKWMSIAQIHEGWYPGSNSYRLNNPGNLRCTNYTKSLGENNGCSKNNFVFYKTLEIGTNALLQFFTDAATDKLRSYKSTMTLLDFYKVYAPSGDKNNPLNYATIVAKYIGVPITTKIKDLLESPLTQDLPPTSDFTPYSQSDSRWKDIVIGKSGNKIFTIGTDGCFITCLSMMTNTPPDETFKKLKAGGAITGGGLIDSVKAANVLGLQYNGKDYNIDHEPKYSPSIKEVNYRRWLPGFIQHFVLRIIKGNKKAIIDPLGAKERVIDYYGFKSYRLFRK